MKIDKYFDLLESLLSKSKLVADWRLSFMEDISSSFAPSKNPIRLRYFRHQFGKGPAEDSSKFKKNKKIILSSATQKGRKAGS